MNAGTLPPAAEGRLLGVMDAGARLTSVLDTRTVINSILRMALDLFPAADCGALALYDQKTERLLFYDTVGLGTEAYSIAMRPGEGMTGSAFSSGTPKLYPDPDSTRAAMATNSPENFHLYTQATRGLREPQCGLFVPIAFQDSTLGALSVENLRNPGVFSRLDLEVLAILGRHAAIAIANSRLFEEAQTAYRSASNVGVETRAKLERARQRSRVITGITEIAYSNQRGSDVIDELERLFGSMICVFDQFGQQITFEGQYCVPAVGTKINRPVRDILDAHGSIRIAEQESPRIVATPVVMSSEFLGVVSVESHNANVTLDPSAVLTAMPLIGGVLLQARAEFEMSSQRNQRLVEALLDGLYPQRGLLPSITLDPPIYVLACPFENEELPGSRHTLTKLVSKLATAYGIVAMVAWHGRNLVAVITGSHGRKSISDQLDAFSKEVLNILESMVDGYHYCFLSDSIGSPQEIHIAYRECGIAIEALATERGGMSGSTVITVPCLGAYRLLIRSASDVDVVRYCRDAIGQAVEYDHEHGSELVHTAKEFFSSASKVSPTAAKLGIHPHTVQYRLRRFARLCGLDLSSAQDRLTAELAVRILTLSSDPVTETAGRRRDAGTSVTRSRGR